jgi:DNA uptake protein ComE-like DNA-binding protein
MTARRFVTSAALAVAIAVCAPPARAQVLKSGVADLNAVPEATLATMPGITPAIAKAFVDQRPFASIVEANAFLVSQKLTSEQLTALYEKAFVHVNLNTATNEQILLIPNISQSPKTARRITTEFVGYRPWKTVAQFDREFGKYVDPDGRVDLVVTPAETNRLKRYVFIPLNLNTATDEQFLTIPSMAQRMLIEFKEYRPWKTKEQFDREIGKYVGPKETARLWRFMVIE